jgi:hypothetical protein
MKLNHHPWKNGSGSQVAAGHSDGHCHGIDLRHWESMVVHSYNPNYSGGRDQKDLVLDQLRQKVREKPSE